MSKYNILPQFKCQIRILNVKILYSASVRMSKFDIGQILNVKNRKKKSEKRKAKNEYKKRKTKSEKGITKSNNEK